MSHTSATASHGSVRHSGRASSNWEAIKKLNRLFNQRDKWIFALLVSMMFVGAGLEILGVGAIPLFVAAAASPEKLLAHRFGRAVLVPLGWTNSRDLVVWGGLILIGIFGLRNGYLVLVEYLQLRFATNRQARLATRLFSAYMYAPMEFHFGRNSAELLRNTSTEVRAVCRDVIMPLLDLTMNALMALGIVGVLTYEEPLIALSALGIVGGLGGGVVRQLQKRVKSYGLEAQDHRKGLVQAVNQGLGILKEARISHREGFFIDSLAHHAQRSALAQRFQALVSHLTTYLMETIAVTAMVSLAVFLVASGRSIDVVVPTLALFGTALIRLKVNATKVAGAVNQLSYNLVAVHPVHDDLLYLEGAARPPRALSGGRMYLQNYIEVKDLSYRYPGTHTCALRHVSLRILKGQSVGFVGATGAGKTTMADVILGLLAPTVGQVLVDGEDTAGRISAWQANIGYVPQFIYLTDDTIRRNIALGLSDAKIDEARIADAVRAAQLGGFAASLPFGLDTIVGERGTRLSGGQRQRIGLARALYLNPEVLVLDEGTSALDNETEKAVMEAVHALKGSRTILMIAHRLSTVRICDTVFRFSEGEMVSQGSPSDVLPLGSPSGAAM